MPENTTNFISSEKLNDLLNSGESITLVDTRFDLMQPQLGREAYMKGHLPEAVYMPMEFDFSARVSEHGGRHPLPDSTTFIKRLGQLGITPDKKIVIYDDTIPEYASRLWWMLKFLYGYNWVYLLEGGYQAWKEAGFSVQTKIPSPLQISDLSLEANTDSYYDAHPLNQKLENDENFALLDARAPERYNGEEELLDTMAGHIPGAINFHWENAFDENGKLLYEDLERCVTDFAHYDEIVAYCGSGVTACAVLLALDESGIANIKLYPGSWSDWITYADLPKVLNQG